MYKFDSINFQLDAMFIQDSKKEGYTSYFKQFPNIIAEGKSIDEALTNLLNAAYDVLNYQSSLSIQEENCKNSTLKIIEKPLKFKIELIL